MCYSSTPRRTPRRIAGGIAHFDLHRRVALGDILDAAKDPRHCGGIVAVCGVVERSVKKYRCNAAASARHK